MSGPSIQLRGLAKAFGAKQVLRDVTVDAPAGQSLVIIGASGTGKSVTLKLILGLLHSDAGQILIDGQDSVRWRGRKRAELMRRIGVLFQGAALFDSLRIWENVAFAATHADRMPRAKARDLAAETLAKVGLDESVLDLRPAALSGGMQKRVGLARAVATKPDILFFDEPTTGLDPITADAINRLIRATVTDLGVTALSITHDMGSVRHIADRVAMLHAGVIQWDGPVTELDSTDNPYVRQFVSGSVEGPIPTVFTGTQTAA